MIGMMLLSLLRSFFKIASKRTAYSIMFWLYVEDQVTDQSCCTSQYVLVLGLAFKDLEC
jgi:hypothetical protein